MVEPYFLKVKTSCSIPLVAFTANLFDLVKISIFLVSVVHLGWKLVADQTTGLMIEIP